MARRPLGESDFYSQVDMGSAGIAPGSAANQQTILLNSLDCGVEGSVVCHCWHVFHALHHWHSRAAEIAAEVSASFLRPGTNDVGIKEQIALRADEAIVVAGSRPYLKGPIGLIDPRCALMSGNGEELKPILVVQFGHVHHIGHLHPGLGQLRKECADELIQVQESVVIVLRVPVIGADVSAKDAGSSCQVAFQPCTTLEAG